MHLVHAFRLLMAHRNNYYSQCSVSAAAAIPPGLFDVDDSSEVTFTVGKINLSTGV